MNVLVTGACGFIGSSLANALVEQNHKVYAVDNLSGGFRKNLRGECEFIWCDVAQEGLELRLPANIDTVYHLASCVGGLPAFENPLEDLSANAGATLRLLKWSQRAGVKRFVFASSMAVYGNPVDGALKETDPPKPIGFYGVSKLAAERYCEVFHSLGLPTTALRLFNVYGPNQNFENMKQGMVSIFLSFLRNGQQVQVKGPLNRTRDFVYIDDVVRAFILASSPQSAGQIYNVASGVETSVGDLIGKMQRLWGTKDESIGSLPATPLDQQQVFGSNAKISKDLGWHPTVDLEEGLTRTIAWLKRLPSNYYST